MCSHEFILFPTAFALTADKQPGCAHCQGGDRGRNGCAHVCVPTNVDVVPLQSNQPSPHDSAADRLNACSARADVIMHFGRPDTHACMQNPCGCEALRLAWLPKPCCLTQAPAYGQSSHVGCSGRDTAAKGRGCRRSRRT